MEDLRQSIADIISAKIGKRPLNDQSWWELDVDSIVMAEIVHELEQKFNLRLNERVFETENINEMAALIEQLREDSISNP